MAEADLIETAYNEDVWLGASDRRNEGSYREVTGRTMRWRSWDIGEPDGNADDCASMDSTGPDVTDEPCGSALDFLCEYDGEPVDRSTF